MIIGVRRTGDVMAYVTRHHPFSALGAMCLGCAVLTAGSVGLYREPWYMVPGVLFFGFGTVATAVPLVRREVAMRVDGTGIGDDKAMVPWDAVLWLDVDDRYVWIATGEVRELTPEDFDDVGDFHPGRQANPLYLRGLPHRGTRFRRDRFDMAVREYSPRVAGTAPHTYPQQEKRLGSGS
jgi:hypothetical protein